MPMDSNVVSKKAISAEDVFADELEAVDKLPSVEADFKVVGNNLVITVPLHTTGDKIRWSESELKGGGRKRNGLMVALGKIPSDAKIVLDMPDGKQIACAATSRTLAVNLSFDPMKRTIIRDKPPAASAPPALGSAVPAKA